MNKKYFGLIFITLLATGTMIASDFADEIQNEDIPLDEPRKPRRVMARIELARLKEAEEKSLFTIPEISELNLERFKNELISHVNFAHTKRKALYTAGAVGAGYLIYRFFRSNAKDGVNQKEHKKLTKKVTDLEKQKDALEERIALLEKGYVPPAQSWFDWTRAKLSGFKSVALDWLPERIQDFLLMQVSGVVIASLPQLSSSMSFNPTLSWCLYERTNFVSTLTMYMNWYQRIAIAAQDPDQFYFLWRDFKKEYAVCTQQFVKETEKVLGYMAFVHDSLKAEELVLRARVELSVDSMVNDINRLIEIINGFLELDNNAVSIEAIGALLKEWQTTMFSVLGHLENFEMATHAAGFAEIDSKSGRIIKGRCTALKKWIIPQLQMHAAPEVDIPETSQQEQIAQELLAQAMESGIS